ncbi:glycosyltransferase [Ruminococcaceae bacterium OttesenSCG-928-I18]|nr:glycosyltransferase [Ruminococcaceae bacterium OttesenSCG-928-I18]
MKEKDKNYLSAVIYLGNEKDSVKTFLEMLTQCLEERFEHYELIFVEDASQDGTEEEVRAYLAAMEAPPATTIVHMSLRQSLELALNAGVDIAIGDFVYEFDSMQMPWPPQLVMEAYEACLEGSDIVAVAPKRNRGVFSNLFYTLFNSSSGSKYPLRTEAFRVLSRRAINRVRSVSGRAPYRKAAYAACGLRLRHLEYQGEAAGSNEALRFSRALDSLAMYTSLAFKISLGIALFMMILMLVAVVYTLVVFLGPFVNPSPGWTTTMLVVTGGFSGVFLILAVVLKYLSLLVELVFKKQNYLVESVEKIT